MVMAIATTKIDTYWKGVLAALFLILLSSCSSCCQVWHFENTLGTLPTYNSSRIYLCPGCETNGLELELVRTTCGLNLYINVFGLEVPADCNDPETTQVYVSFREYSYTFPAFRFVGGQRLLIPADARDEIISWLMAGQSVYLRVGRYDGDIMPDKFGQVFERLLK